MTRSPILTTILLLFLTCSAHAQTAKVIQLSPDDAATAKRFYEEYKAAELRWQKFQETIKVQYTQTVKGDKGGERYCTSGTIIFDADGVGRGVTSDNDKDCVYYRVGWSSGFEFSADFRFIVPTSLQTGMISSQPCNGIPLTSTSESRIIR